MKLIAGQGGYGKRSGKDRRSVAQCVLQYKDGVRPFFEATTDRIVTYHFMLHDQPGVLSSILGLMARSGANLLTVNQSIPREEWHRLPFRPAPVR